jgi:hypothetical protein
MSKRFCLLYSEIYDIMAVRRYRHMEIDEIAAVSMGMSMANASASLDIAVTKKAMEMEQLMAAQLLQSLEAALPTPPVSFGHKLDVWA